MHIPRRPGPLRGPGPRGRWNPALALGCESCSHCWNSELFQSFPGSALGASLSLKVARPTTCSTSQKTGGSRGRSPARGNSAGCCLRSRCVLLRGEMQGSRRKKWEWVPLLSPVNGLCQNFSDPAYSVHATWRLELSVLDSEQRHVDPVYLLQVASFSVAGVLAGDGGDTVLALTLREVMQLLVYFL